MVKPDFALGKTRFQNVTAVLARIKKSPGTMSFRLRVHHLIGGTVKECPKCGWSRFEATEERTMPIIVGGDETPVWYQDVDNDDDEEYDCGSPQGPFVCRQCKEVFPTWQDISDLPDPEEEK